MLILSLGSNTTGGGSTPTAPPPGFDPTQITNLQLWLDGDDVSSLSLGGGNEVNQWSDKSGNSRNFTGSGATRPIYNAGTKSVDFDGSDDFLTIDDLLGIGLTIDKNIFIVLATNLTAIDRIIDVASDTSAIGGRLSLTSEYGARNRSAFIVYDQAANITQAEIIYYRSDSGGTVIEQALEVNRVALGESSSLRATKELSFSGTLSRIGAASNGTANYDGSIFEIIIYNKNMLTQEIDDVYTYLENKWSI